MLGAVGARTSDRSDAPLGSRSQRLVLAVLAAHRGSVVRDDVLVDALWDEPPPSATKTLRSLVSRLRRVVGDVVERHGDGYVLQVAAQDVDAGRFDELVDEAERSAPDEAARLLDAALRLWRGPAFGEFGDLEAVRAEAARLEQRRRSARRARAAALLACGRTTEAAEVAEALVAEESLDEASWAVLVRARAAEAPGEALRVHQRALAALAAAGLEPSAQLRDAEQEALRGGAEPIPAPSPGASRITRPAGPRTSLVGRDADLVALGQLVTRTRLVSLLGHGGVGKTRLATEVARGVATSFELGARLVSLAEVRAPEEVAPAVVEGLELSAAGSPDVALERAGDLHQLLVLDNCEHVVDAVAAVVDRLLDGGPSLHVVATSREPLRIAGEHRWPVPPLDDGGAALDLFVDRARAVRPDLVLDDEAQVLVRRIVDRLDGLPLAIEMAAALTASLGLPELLRTVTEDVASLRSPVRGATPRHRTLQDVVDWSVARCSDDERRMLGELGVFEGLIGLDQIEAVVRTDEVPVVLNALVERSLVDVVADELGTRYRMLDTVRRYARAGLDGGPDVRRRHAEHQLERLSAADRGLRTDEEASAHQVIENGWAELRGAHRWAASADPALATELSRNLHVWAVSRHRVDAFRWASRLVAETGTGPAIGFTSRAYVLVAEGNLRDAVTEGEVALHAGDAVDRLHALEVLSDAALFRGDLEAAEAMGVELRRVAEDEGDARFVVAGASAVCLARAYAGHIDEGLRALEIEAGVPVAAPTDLGWLAYSAGEALLDERPEESAVLLRRAIAHADEVDNRLLGSVARLSLVTQEARWGEPASASSTFVEVLEHWRRHGSLTHLVTTLRNLVVYLSRIGEPVAAARLLGAVDANAHKPTFGAEAERLDRTREELVARLGSAEAAHRAAGASMRLAEAVDEGRAVLVAGASRPG